MIDWNFGNLDDQQLTLRLYVPLRFEEWTDHGHHFSWTRLFSLNNWIRVIKNKYSWRIECGRWAHSTHRCYCSTGTIIDGNITVFGFGVRWWYSYYTGKIPCLCDEVIDELMEE